MLRARKKLLFRLKMRLSCLLVVVALMSAPVDHVAHAGVMAPVPAQELNGSLAPGTNPCENSRDCKMVCRGGDTRLLGPWSSSPRNPEPCEFQVLPERMPAEGVPFRAVVMTRSWVAASQNQAAYLFTNRLRL